MQPSSREASPIANGAVRQRPGSFWRNLTATIFSFPAVCLMLLVIVVFAASVKKIAEPDIWWHLRNARYLLVNHSFPSVDTYSFTATGSAWLNHEWLSEIPFYLGFRAAELRGLLLVYFSLLLLIFAGVYYLSCLAGAERKNAAVATLGAILLGEVSVGPRMLLFGWLCMVGLLIVLERFRQTGRGLWMLPPLFAVWINFHGSWVFGLVVLAITIASGLVEGEWGLVFSHRWTQSELRKLLIAVGASIVALFANPFGYKLVLYPFDLLFRQQTNLKHIDEWMSVDFQTGTGRLALAAILAVLAAALFSRRRWRLDGVGLTAFALWAALTHVRFLFFLGLIVVPILAPRLKFFPPHDPDAEKPWLNAVIMAGIVAGLIFFFPSEAVLQATVDATYPTAALAFMQKQHINGRIFNNYGFGGYMEWVAPEFKPFIDGRADLFVYNGTFDEHVHAASMESTFEILDKHQIEYALLKPDQPLTYVLQHASGWKTIYADKTAVLLQRVPPLVSESPAPSQ